MEFLMQNIDTIIVSVVLIVGIVIFVRKFTQLPTEQQYNQIRAWLLQAILLAEKQFGGKTGRLKLSYVYDLFVRTFPWIAKIIPFELFSKFVDQVLEEAKELWSNNDAIAAYIVDRTDSK